MTSVRLVGSNEGWTISQVEIQVQVSKTDDNQSRQFS